jgi:hypothetical protein
MCGTMQSFLTFRCMCPMEISASSSIACVAQCCYPCHTISRTVLPSLLCMVAGKCSKPPSPPVFICSPHYSPFPTDVCTSSPVLSSLLCSYMCGSMLFRSLLICKCSLVSSSTFCWWMYTLCTPSLTSRLFHLLVLSKAAFPQLLQYKENSNCPKLWKALVRCVPSTLCPYLYPS